MYLAEGWLTSRLVLQSHPWQWCLGEGARQRAQEGAALKGLGTIRNTPADQAHLEKQLLLAKRMAFLRIAVCDLGRR
jgi:hypothetical protein